MEARETRWPKDPNRYATDYLWNEVLLTPEQVHCRLGSTVADATGISWACSRGINPTANMECPYGTGELGLETGFLC
jgi:hypothetical protein